MPNSSRNAKRRLIVFSIAREKSPSSGRSIPRRAPQRRRVSTMVKPRSSLRDLVVERMIDGLQTNNMMKAVAAGIEVVEHYDGCFSDDNAEKNVGLRLTLANLLVSVRRAPGDLALSARLNRKSLTMLPPSMDNQRFRINSDLSATLSSLAQEGGALEPGAEVTVSGLKARPELNGGTGTIVVWYPDRGRYAVKVGDAEEVALKPINVGQTAEMFDEAYLARVREATDIAKALDPDAGGQEETYPNELRELKCEALEKAYTALDAFTRVRTHGAGDDVSVKATSAERYVKVHDDERFSGLKIEICEALDGAAFKPAEQVQARYNWGAALCRAGRIEEGKERYEQALEMLTNPGASGAERLRKDISGSILLCDRQISGEQPRTGAFIELATGDGPRYARVVNGGERKE